LQHCFLQIVIYELLTMPILQRLKVSIRLVIEAHRPSSRVRFNTRLWIGLDKLWTSRLDWVVLYV